MPRSVVGTFLVGQRLVGQNSVDLASAKLRLAGKPYSVVATSDAEVVVLPTRARMLLRSRAFTLTINQGMVLTAPRLHLLGRTYSTIVPVGPTYAQKPVLHLAGKPFTLRLEQTVQLGKPALRLVALRMGRAGQSGLIPSIPETIVLTPAPAELGVLVPVACEPVVLVPTVEKVV
jgi:hypothetical protein